jgi:hypothetical protein
MSSRLAAALALLIAAAQPARAQVVSADQFRLRVGSCPIRSGVGAPPTMSACDVYVDSTTGRVWISGGLSAPADLTLAPVGDIVVSPGGRDVLPAAPYETNLGSLQRKFLGIYGAELWVETLVAQNTIATIGGRVLVAPTNVLAADLGAGASTISVKYNNLSNANGGDVVYLEAGGQVEFMRIVSAATGSGPYAYSVTRNLDGSGANAWVAGDAVVNTGTTGNGFIDVYVQRGVRSNNEIGPTMVGNRRNSTTYNDWSPVWAIGNLRGLYGYSSLTDVYGTAFGNPSGAWVKIDATNGVRLGYNTTNTVSIDVAGNALIAGFNIIPNYLYSGATGASRVVMSSDGVDAFWAGAVNAVDAPFRVTATGALTASSATITGNITATSGNVLAALAAGSITAAKIAAGTITATQIASGTITATQIASNTITAGNIAGGTITGAKIAAGTITASNLSVGTLSAISANLGTVTAGTLTAVTVQSSGGDMVINNSGITLGGSQSTAGAIKFSGGPQIYTTGSYLVVDGSGASTGVALVGNAHVSGLAGSGNRHVCVTGAGDLYAGTSSGC